MSGKKVVLLGDIGTDHNGFPPTPVTAGSPDVLIDGKPIARVGDPLAPHSKPKHPPHPRAIASGSSTVLINGIPAAVTGSTISCGGVTIGSGSVVIGDTYSPVPFSGTSPSQASGKAKPANGSADSLAVSGQSHLANGTNSSSPRPGDTQTTLSNPAVATKGKNQSDLAPGMKNAKANGREASMQEAGNTLRIGIFFDGTGNHKYNDRKLTNRDVTNVGKLHDLYRDQSSRGTVQSIYIPGPGTSDGQQTQDGFETQEHTLNMALGVGNEGGHSRITEAVLNTRQALGQGDFDKVVFDVFGFSRGAALARHFVNLVHQWPQTLRIPTFRSAFSGDEMLSFENIPAFPEDVIAEVNFLGIFDTVGSFYLPGNNKNLDFNLNLAAASTKRVVHLTAHHEIRKHFPLSSVMDARGNGPSHFTEKPLPGAHADVGGGYENPDKDFENIEKIILGIHSGLADGGHTQRTAISQLEQKYAKPGRTVVAVPQPNGDIHVQERRRTRKELAIYALHQMHRYAVECGVPLDGLDPSSDDYALPESLRRSLNEWKSSGMALDAAKQYLGEYIHTSHDPHYSLSNPPHPTGRREIYTNSPAKAEKPMEIADHAVN